MQGGMYRVQIRVGRKWKLGLHDYTFDQAVQRFNKLREAGIKARIVPSYELFE